MNKITQYGQVKVKCEIKQDLSGFISECKHYLSVKSSLIALGMSVP